jgi:hypothetical protein
MKPANDPGAAASANITRRIRELGNWRGDMLARVRAPAKKSTRAPAKKK